jgi:hypothetical protein
MKFDSTTKGFLFLTREELTRATDQPYEDFGASTYHWDSTVPNHAIPAAGDVILVWNEKTSIGISLIESISIALGEKLLPECPSCRRKQVRERKTLEPRYVCAAQTCKHEFEIPIWIEKSVTNYRSHHATGWINLRGKLSSQRCREIAFQSRSQHSIRPMNMHYAAAVMNSLAGIDFSPFQEVYEKSKRL